MNTEIRIILSLALLASLGGCAGRQDKNVLARIDQKYTITLKDFNDRISKLPQRYQDVINKNKKQFLDEVIIDTLLYNEALRQKLDRDKEVMDVIEEAKKKIVIARLLQSDVEEGITITDVEIEEYYNANREKFAMPEVLRASHILVKTDGEANEVLAALSAGGNFEELARTHSVDPTASTGGDIGYFTKGQLVPEIEEACYNMQVGDISGVVKTQFGYHIIKLTEKREPHVRALDEVSDSIKQALQRLKKRALFNQFVTKLKEKSKISVNEKLLDDISLQEKPEE